MKKPSKKLPKDPNKLAFEVVRMATEEEKPPEPEQPTEPVKERSPISAYLAEIGRKGGLKGGKARAEKLTPEKRKEIAKKAAEKRWKSKK
ncbi:MAG TPA: hypothetical protein VGJ94_15175 [Syntrophorhabdaceae bacterium]|jgi:hypothetical protein